MGIAKHMIFAKHVAATERFGSRFLEVFAHRRIGIGNGIPRLSHAISWIVYPGRALQVISLREVFRCARTKRRPAALLFGGILRHLNWIVNEALTALDSVQKEGVHEIAYSHAKTFFARSEFVVGHG